MTAVQPGPARHRRGPTSGEVVRTGRIRTWGPVTALVVPLGLGLLAAAVLRLWPCDGSACGTPYLGAWGLLLIAVPTSLIAGLPWFASPVSVVAAVLSSLGLWGWLGLRAARQATSDIDATWGTYWRELGFLAGGVAVGVLLGGLLMLVILTFL